MTEELITREQARQWFLQLRGIETPCQECGGTGVRTYPSTSVWMGGIGGDAITQGVCDRCWGTGDENVKGVNLKKLYSKVDEKLLRIILDIVEEVSATDTCNAELYIKRIKQVFEK